MRKTCLLLALALCASPALAQTTPAAQVAANLQSMVGNSFDGGLKLTAIRAEGSTLILTVDGTSGWGAYPRDHAVNGFLEGFCKNPNAVTFFQTSTVRVDTLNKGADLQQGPIVNKCPPAAAPAGGKN